MICRHCLMSIKPYPSEDSGYYVATEGEQKGLISCPENPDDKGHQPDEVPTPTGVEAETKRLLQELKEDLHKELYRQNKAYYQEYPPTDEPEPKPRPDLHCKTCGELLRPFGNRTPNGRDWWALASDPIGDGYSRSRSDGHKHQPINSPTKDNN